MSLRELLPYGRARQHGLWGELEDSISSLQKEINHVFADFPVIGRELWKTNGGFSPRIDVSEGKDTIKVTGEFPGMDEKDIEVTVTEHALILRGEKKTETEDKSEERYIVERTYGSFRRVIPLPEGVDKDKVAASFKKGVLKIEIPYTPSQKEGSKKVPIKAE